MLNNLKQRNEMLKNPLIVIVLVVTIVIGFYTIRQASQVAHQDELNSQLIHEQQKVQEVENDFSKLKYLVQSQQSDINNYKTKVDNLTSANENLSNENGKLSSQNDDLSKKFRELAKP